MNDVIMRIKDEISAAINEYGSESEYAKGLKRANQIIEESLCHNLMLNHLYYAILFKNGDKNFPYIQKVRLYNIRSKKKTIYSFTEQLNCEVRPYPDLVLSNPKSISERIFFTEESAQRFIVRSRK